MSAAVVTLHGRRFPDLPTRFPGGVVEAVAWYATGPRVGLLEAAHAPPVDATGDAVIDQYLCDVFAALTKMPWATLRIAHLLGKALDNRRAADACRASAAKGGEGAPMFAAAANDHDRLVALMERWADAFHAASTAPPPSAA